MSKYPSLNDRDWPKDIPAEYFTPLDRATEEGQMKWAAITPLFLSLLRRVDELERRLEGAA